VAQMAQNTLMNAPENLNWNQLDEQWRQRHDAEQLLDFETILDRALFRQGDALGYPLLWRWARLSHFRAMQASDDQEAIRHFEAGVEEAKKAILLQPHRVEGHFWLGVNQLEAGRRKGWAAAARALSTASKHIERSMNLEEEYHFAGPLRVWARVTHLKPLILGGSLDRAIEIYRRALQIAPHNSTTLLYYSEALLADQQKPLARQILTSIIENPDDPDWRWEQERDRQQARKLLETMN
jgi:tetratricopeptide (TPR) repeat protein